MHALKPLVARIKLLFARFSPRQRKFALGGSAAAVLLALVYGVLIRGENVQAIATTLRSPMSIFASRSPGARLGGVLAQTKPKLASKAGGRSRPTGGGPRERVLSVGRTRPVPQFAMAPDLAPQVGLSAIPVGFAAAPGFDVPTGIGPGFDVPGFGFGGTPGFGGGPGGGVPGGTTPDGGAPGGSTPGGGTPGDTTPGGGSAPGGNAPGTGGPAPDSPGSAVPETSTWLMMILGFGAAGMTLRRRGVLIPAVSTGV